MIRREGEVAIDADKALAATKSTNLASGPARQTLIVERGAERGFSDDQLHRAKRVLGIKAFKQRGQAHAPWLWALPQDVPAEEGEPE